MRKALLLWVLLFGITAAAVCRAEPDPEASAGEVQFPPEMKVWDQLPGPEKDEPAPAEEGPFNDEVWGAVSEDGLSFTELPGPFFQKASVPDVAEITQDSPAGRPGTLLLYFADFSDKPPAGAEGISVSSLTGQQWSTPKAIILRGKRNAGAAVDPSVVQLPDGRLRLYYFGSEVRGEDPALDTGEHRIYSAVSQDGVKFQVEPGIRFKGVGMTDPEVLQVGPVWWMFLSRGSETLLATSVDGLQFLEVPGFRLSKGGVPGAVQLPDGRVRIFVSGPEGIVSFIGRPSTQVVESEEGTRIPQAGAGIVADPACIRRQDGSYYLIFKKRPYQ